MKTSLLSSGIIPVFISNEPEFLILRAYTYWDFPKGLVERGEDPLASAVRELKEETSIERIEFSWGREFIETPPYSKGKIARYYVGHVKKKDVSLGVSVELGRPEHHEYRWCTFEEATKLLVPRVRRVLNWASEKISAGRTPEL